MYEPISYSSSVHMCTKTTNKKEQQHSGELKYDKERSGCYQLTQLPVDCHRIFLVIFILYLNFIAT